MIIIKNWKIFLRIVFKQIIAILSDNRGEASLPDFGKFYRDAAGVLYYENDKKIFKITSRHIEKIKDKAPTLKQRITELINSELIR